MTRVVVAYATAPAWDLLRAEAARLHGVARHRIVLGHECPRCGSPEHGRPRILPTATVRRPAYASLSRAGGLSVVALTDAGEVGVDLEPVGAAEFDGFAAVALHPSEGDGDPTRAWVRKEAVLKAYGVGLRVDPADVRLDGDGDSVLDPDDLLPGRGRVRLQDVPVPGLVAAVAVVLAADEADAHLEVTVHHREG